MRRRWPLAIVLAATFALVSPSTTTAAEHTVTARSNPQPLFNASADCNATFSGSRIDINAGDTVLWRNCDTTISHTVTSDEGKFDLPLPPGGATRLRFESPGTYPYFCEIHGQSMQGTVIVRGAGAATTTAPPAATTTAPPAATTTAPPATTSTTAPATTTTTVASTTTSAPTTTSTTEPETTTSTGSTTTSEVALDAVDVDDDADEGAGPLLVLGLIAVLVAIGVVATILWRRRNRVA